MYCMLYKLFISSKMKIDLRLVTNRNQILDMYVYKNF